MANAEVYIECVLIISSGFSACLFLMHVFSFFYRLKYSSSYFTNKFPAYTNKALMSSLIILQQSLPTSLVGLSKLN